MKYNVELQIENVPETAIKYPYWVILNVSGKLWYYGAYSSENNAVKALDDVNNGFVVKR